MAISPVASTIYANQVAPAASNIQGDLQAKFDIQNTIAAATLNDEQKRIEQTRPTEESHKLDPENEQEKKQKNEEEKEQKNEQEKDQTTQENTNEFSAKDFGEETTPAPKLNIVV